MSETKGPFDKEYHLAWYYKNKEKVRMKQNASNAINAEKRRLYHRQYYHTHAQRKAEMDRIIGLKNQGIDSSVIEDFCDKWSDKYFPGDIWMKYTVRASLDDNTVTLENLLQSGKIEYF